MQDEGGGEGGAIMDVYVSVCMCTRASRKKNGKQQKKQKRSQKKRERKSIATNLPTLYIINPANARGIGSLYKKTAAVFFASSRAIGGKGRAKRRNG